MDDLPELPFEKVLSYLNLEDLIKSRAVSRRWYYKINSFKVKSLCYSERPSNRIFEKSRLVGGSFGPSFIRSSSFERFFGIFGQSILSGLKKLRLCELRLNIRSRKTLVETVESFGQLEELSIIRFGFLYDLKMKFKLSLPMLNSIHLESLPGIELTLDAPGLRKVKLRDCSSDLRLEIVHTESVEWLATDHLDGIATSKLNKVKYLYLGRYEAFHSTFLSDLDQLKEFHVLARSSLREIFEQKQRYGRADLKIYFCGLLLDGPNDPAIDSRLDKVLGCLAENPSRMADEIPFYTDLDYSTIENVAPELATKFLNRCTDLSKISVNQLIKNNQPFLDCLSSNHIAELEISMRDQRRDLFDRLPSECAVQKLIVHGLLDYEYSIWLRNFEFLFKFENLISLFMNQVSGRTFYLSHGKDLEVKLIRRILEEIPLLSEFKFCYKSKIVEIEVENRERYRVTVGRKQTLADVNAAIQFIINSSQRNRKRKARELE